MIPEWVKVLAGSAALMIGASGPSLFAEWYRIEYDARSTVLNRPYSNNLQQRESEKRSAEPPSSVIKEKEG